MNAPFFAFASCVYSLVEYICDAHDVLSQIVAPFAGLRALFLGLAGLDARDLFRRFQLGQLALNGLRLCVWAWLVWEVPADARDGVLFCG